MLKVVLVLAFLGILLAGSLAPDWFSGRPDPDASAPTTTEPGPPSTTLVPIDVRPAPPTTDAPAPVHLGTMLDGEPHLLRPDPPAVLFVGGVPLEIRRIERLSTNADCDGLRTTLEQWLSVAAILDEIDPVDAGDISPDVIEVARAASVFARASFDALAELDCG